MKVRVVSDLTRTFFCASLGLRYQRVLGLFPFYRPVFSLHVSVCMSRYSTIHGYCGLADMPVCQARAFYPSQACRQCLMYCSASALPASLRFVSFFCYFSDFFEILGIGFRICIIFDT